MFFIKGIFMGAADVIPGVSGGTVAFITGIYFRLINSISSVDYSFITLFLKGKFKDSFKVFKKIDFSLFIPLGLGILLSIFFLSKLMNYLLNNYSSLTFAFFFGLILGSSILLLKYVGKINYEKIIMFSFGFVFAYVLAGVSSMGINNSLLMIFFAGALAICAMILPGISGAFILLLLNQYHYLVSALHNYDLVVVGTFGLGAITGLISFSKLLNYLVKHFQKLLIAFLIGLMVGSLRVPYLKIVNNLGSIWLVFGFVLIGLFIVVILKYFFDYNSSLDNNKI